MPPPPRRSLCVLYPKNGAIVHDTDPSFQSSVRMLYSDAETDALDSLIRLKSQVREAAAEHWWRILLHGLAVLTNSQYAFVSKRQAFDPASPSVQLPELGQPGSQLTVLHTIFDDGLDLRYARANISYPGFGCPCAEMRHGKVFFMPSGFAESYPDSPNRRIMAVPPEAYMGIPLFSGNQCFAHFALIWSSEAIAQSKLSWGFIESLCHSVEDIITQQLSDVSDASEPTHVGPVDSLIPALVQSATQILARHAETLSHELRTPMQGIVGTLDMMRTTLERGKDGSGRAGARDVLRSLDDDLDAVQESAGRAIEVADNIVRAYEMNLGLLSNSMAPQSGSEASSPSATSQTQASPTPSQRTESSGQRITLKRRRSASDPDTSCRVKTSISTAAFGLDVSENRRSWSRYGATEQSRTRLSNAGLSQNSVELSPSPPVPRKSSSCSSKYLPAFGRGLQLTDLRDILERVVREGVKIGNKSCVSIISGSAHGELLQVETARNDGSASSKTVEWSVDPSVPSSLLVDERSLAKAISCIFRNSVKFTDEGHISLRATFDEKHGVVKINVKDTGPGISPGFRPEIFKPFSKEDQGTTRRTEGLGLGLMVAKGLTRKLGGDLNLVSADVSGPNRGTEFGMTIPASPTIQETKTSPGPASTEDFQSPHLEGRRASQAEAVETPPSIPLANDLTAKKPQLPTPERSRSSITSSPTVSPLGPRHTPLPSSNITKSGKIASAPTAVSPADIAPRPPLFRHSIPYDPPTVYPHASTQLVSPPQLASTPSPLGQPLTSTSWANSPNANPDLATACPCKILVAEDNSVNRRLLVSMLAKLGYDPKSSIVEAFDGDDAVRQVQSSMASLQSPPSPLSPFFDHPISGPGHPYTSNATKPIDIILMDLWMPNKDGFEASTEILQMYGTMNQTTTFSRPPTIFAVTADSTEGAAEKAAAAGMRGLLLKPFKLKDLENLVRQGWLMRELATAQDDDDAVAGEAWR